VSDFILWTLINAAWVAAFAVFEYRALRHPENKNRVTLSRYVWTIGQNFPLSIWFMGVVAGGLAVHFFWHWCPDLGSVNGLMNLPLR
jgi:hypothetical protein